MATSHRVIYRNVQGSARLNFNLEPITQASAIVITAAQFNFFGGTFGAAGRPILSDANVYVTNIGPHDPEGGSGGVEFYLRRLLKPNRRNGHFDCTRERRKSGQPGNH
jgi:hypothetical protein